jgi:hypothetical protein
VIPRSGAPPGGEPPPRRRQRPRARAGKCGSAVRHRCPRSDRPSTSAALCGKPAGVAPRACAKLPLPPPPSARAPWSCTTTAPSTTSPTSYPRRKAHWVVRRGSIR